MNNTNLTPSASKSPEIFKNDIHLEADIVVIGGSFTGVLTAYHLAKSGENVVLLEKNAIGDDLVSTSTNVITQFVDSYLQDLIDKHGEAKAKLIWEAGQKAISEIERIVYKENIDCNFNRCSTFVYALDYNDFEKLREEYRAAKKLDFKNIKFRDINKIGLGELAYMEIENQAKINASKFTKELSEAVKRNGALIFENTEIIDIDDEEERIIIKTNRGNISANKLINTSYNEYNSTYELDDRLKTYKTYFIEARIPKNILPEAIFCGPSDMKISFRVDKKYDCDHIIFSYRSDNDDIEEDVHFENLQECLNDILTNTSYQILYKWASLSTETNDGIPFIGQSPSYENELIATGFGNSTLSYGIISASINRDIVLGSNNKWIELFDPDRISNLWEAISRRLGYAIDSLKERLLGKLIPNSVEDEYAEEQSIQRSILNSKHLSGFKKNSINRNLKHL